MAAIGLALLGVGPGHAAVGFEALASAKSVDVVIASPGVVPFGIEPELGAQVAQTNVSSLGGSTGFASSPYPGDGIRGTPGLLNSQVPLPAPIPGYPLYVASNADSQPKAEVAQPGFSLSSTSAPVASDAVAAGGHDLDGDQGAGRGRAEAHSKVASSSAAASARSVVEAFSAGGILRVGRVEARATASRDASGTLIRASAIEVDGLFVAGQAVALRQGQLVVAGTSQPLAQNPLGAALADAGLTVTPIEAREDPDGVIAPGLEITMVQSPGGRMTTTTWRLGFAMAAVRLAGPGEPPTPGSASGTVEPPTPGSASGTIEPPTPGSASGTVEPDADGSVVPAPVLSVRGEAGTAAGRRSAEPVVGVAVGSARPVDIGLWLYTGLLLGGLSAVVVGQLIRFVGVKATWDS